MRNMTHDIFAAHENLVTRDIGGEIIIVPIRGCVGDLDGAYTLNEVGGAIWRRIDGHTTVGALAVAVAEEYDVTPDEVERDVGEFLSALAGAGLVRGKEE